MQIPLALNEGKGNRIQNERKKVTLQITHVQFRIWYVENNIKYLRERQLQTYCTAAVHR